MGDSLHHLLFFYSLIFSSRDTNILPLYMHKGAMATSALLIFLGDSKIGRKLELQAASLLFIAGTLVQSLAPSLDLVILGRVIYGLGIGKYPAHDLSRDLEVFFE
jgi:MFS family permease